MTLPSHQSEHAEASRCWGLYIRTLCLVLAFVHLDLAVQVLPLIGADGILPAAALLEKVEVLLPNLRDRLLAYPTLLHADSSDAAILGLAVGGGVLALLAASGAVLPRISLLASTGALISLFVAGGDFLQFVHDYLLIEACILAACCPAVGPIWRGLGLAPGSRLPSVIERSGQLWLVFRLMFAMGVEKLPLVNGCASWQNMTYLKRYFESEQPKPTIFGWAMYHLPMEVHNASAIATWVVELAVPLLFFVPALWVRRWSVALISLFMVAIHFTGNFATFNLLTVVLMIPILAPIPAAGDKKQQDAGEGVASQKNAGHQTEHMTTSADEPAARAAGEEAGPQGAGEGGGEGVLGKIVSAARATVILVISVLGLCFMFRIWEDGGVSYLGNANWMMESADGGGGGSPGSLIPQAAVALMRLLLPFHVVSQYGGIFHDTFSHHGHGTLRFRGTNDGTTWEDYGLDYNVEGDEGSVSSWGFVFAPHFPRLQHQFFYEANDIPFYSQAPANPLYHRGNNWFLHLALAMLDDPQRATGEAAAPRGAAAPEGAAAPGAATTKRGAGAGYNEKSGGNGANATAPLELFRSNPFPATPPDVLRVDRCVYRFVPPAKFWETGRFWELQECKPHLPPISMCYADEDTGMEEGSADQKKCFQLNCHSLCSYFKIVDPRCSYCRLDLRPPSIETAVGEDEDGGAPAAAATADDTQSARHRPHRSGRRGLVLSKLWTTPPFEDHLPKTIPSSYLFALRRWQGSGVDWGQDEGQLAANSDSGRSGGEDDGTWRQDGANSGSGAGDAAAGAVAGKDAVAPAPSRPDASSQEAGRSATTDSLDDFIDGVEAEGQVEVDPTEVVAASGAGAGAGGGPGGAAAAAGAAAARQEDGDRNGVCAAGQASSGECRVPPNGLGRASVGEESFLLQQSVRRAQVGLADVERLAALDRRNAHFRRGYCGDFLRNYFHAGDQNFDDELDVQELARVGQDQDLRFSQFLVRVADANGNGQLSLAELVGSKVAMSHLCRMITEEMEVQCIISKDEDACLTMLKVNSGEGDAPAASPATALPMFRGIHTLFAGQHVSFFD